MLFGTILVLTMSRAGIEFNWLEMLAFYRQLNSVLIGRMPFIEMKRSVIEMARRSIYN